VRVVDRRTFGVAERRLDDEEVLEPQRAAPQAEQFEK
jgi:hypothetical protein